MCAVDLAFKLRDRIEQKKVEVIDCRDSDFEGGHIKGCENIPNSDWENIKLSTIVLYVE